MQKTLLVAAAVFAVGIGSLQGQTRRPPDQGETDPVEIALQVGAAKYAASGQGECKAADPASIYGVNASLLSVSHGAGGQSLSLRLWQPKNGSAAMMTLHVALGGKRYEVDTVRTGTKRETKCDGTTTFQKVGSGGVFTIAAATGSGEKISGSIKCARFGGIQAEGG